MFKRTSCVVALSLFGASGVTNAQEEGRIQMGNVDFVPDLTTELLHIDNVTYANDSQENISSWVGIISPQINAVTEFRGNEVEFGYRIERGEYFSSEADNYTDHFGHLAGKYEINDRNRLRASARYEDGHDERGRRYSNGFGNELTSPDTYKNSEVDATYSYGAMSAFGRIDITAGYEDMNYDMDDGVYLFRDREYFKYGAQLFYRVAPSTNLVLDANHQEIEYDEAARPEATLDSKENKVLAGLTWDTNEYTRSFVKVGYKQKKFEAVDREDFSGVAWEVGMTWEPMTYSQFKVNTKADTRETNSEADYIRSRDYSLSWEHFWIDRFSTTAQVAYMTDDYIGDVEDLREDDTTRLTLSADYEFRRWLNFGLFYQMNERDSNRDIIDYDRDVVGITAKVTL
ncbi:outer membrane beta-barrel protein [Alteromonas pelagimontana]|uniref:Outer membrane beta-barrel protein n=1 Tax=Alteromonas pelagimontana TaxID=1858656 RepID=A0A6M4MB26_9ALTE|nr:outer membrane beta-barrel protein [Alteromonas pelagimontana]QJR80199.1 outer membrane beta-barrel protein [Alteromonas pelagimontana]